MLLSCDAFYCICSLRILHAYGATYTHRQSTQTQNKNADILKEPKEDGEREGGRDGGRVNRILCLGFPPLNRYHRMLGVDSAF